ncbi:xylosyltransferase oxt-like [Haliotis rufescens]|uniref:xylosyltransferase oxt-like n=1 Tax=Haliotis rufescens TaxID=6454 RepID=UPI00201F3AAC|nr:xylosyltransferase oxt-like [Haliotis rufescens]
MRPLFHKKTQCLLHNMALSPTLIQHTSTHDHLVLMVMVLFSYNVLSVDLCDDCLVTNSPAFDNLVVLDYHLWSRPAPHPQLCFRLCLLDTNCFSYQFNLNTNSCRGHASTFTSPHLVNTSTETGNKLYLTCKEYLGCFKDSAARILPHPYSSQSLTQEVCTAYCTTEGYALAGTQSGNQCFCGNSIPTGHIRDDENNCQRPCAGNTTLICGGTWYSSVYTT